MENSETDPEGKKLQAELRKLRLESKLRKNLSTELEKQKLVAVEAQREALTKTNELEEISQQLSKYLSPQLYQSIFSGKQHVHIESKRKKLTLFFSDLSGFTSISDSLESEEVTAMLNYYLTEMSRIALDYGGTIDKYVGDAIVIFFGDPETEGVKKDALNCVNMAIAMQKKMQELEGQWAKNFGLKQPLQMRIGINTGYCTVGNFGSENRLDYTVIGGQVNLASRLESISKPGSILVSFDTHSQVCDEVACVEVETVHVKGIREKVRVFEVILDGAKKEDRLTFKTSNLECSMDIDNLEMDEVRELTEFIEAAQKNI
jgi:class 3 adenylate cyclase